MPARMITPTLNLDRLLELRLVVARFGEMDLAKWWNTKGQLGRLGALALRRGFPRTHRFAQARAVFTVAAFRCAEVFDCSASLGGKTTLASECAACSASVRARCV